MKVFLINLDKDLEKLESVVSQLKTLGVEYERVSGIYGKKMDVKAKRNAVSRFRWWCAVGRPVADAEIGCALSHYHIYRRFVGKNLGVGDKKCFCVLEDDVILSPSFKQMLDFVENNIDPDKPQVVILSDHMGQYKETVTSDPYKLHSSSRGMCTDAYVITPVAAEVLLKRNYPLIVPCDSWRRWVKGGAIELFHAVPTVARQDQITYLSSTSTGRRSVSEYSVTEKILHYAKRSIGKAVDELLKLICGR